MVEHFGLDVVTAYMGHVQDNAAESVRRVIEALHDSEFAVETDQGAVIRVRITVDREKREATVDFTGTSAEQKTNFNAPEPVTRAAVLYCFRVMVEGDIPMNAGCLRPIHIVIPDRLDALAALSGGGGRRQCRDLAARHRLPVRRAGRARFGAGLDEQPHLRQRHATSITRPSARAHRPASFRDGIGFNGADAVHTHMTNSRLTDPEILEFRFPVLLEDFHIREELRRQGPAGTPATAPSARCASSKRWTAPSSPRTDKFRRTGLRAANQVSSG